MSLSWMPRDHEPKDHSIGGEQSWGGYDQPPSTVFEKTPLCKSDGTVVDGLHTAWITLNNPQPLNSYTTRMVKGVTAAFHTRQTTGVDTIDLIKYRQLVAASAEMNEDWCDLVMAKPQR